MYICVEGGKEACVSRCVCVCICKVVCVSWGERVGVGSVYVGVGKVGVNEFGVCVCELVRVGARVWVMCVSWCV